MAHAGNKIGTETTTAVAAECRRIESNTPFRGAIAEGNSANSGGRALVRTIVATEATGSAGTGSAAERTISKPLPKFCTMTTGPAGSIVEPNCIQAVVGL